MKIGEARMRPVVEQACVEYPPQTCYDGAGPADYAGEAGWLYPRFINPENEQLKFSHHAWLIETGGKRVLVDPCVGNLRNRPGADFFHMLDTPWLERLAALGAQPESIDYVFCTHLHVDHVGWNTRLQDGRYVPTFPNARYLLPRAEDAFWKLDLEGKLQGFHAFNSGIYAECVLPVIEAGLAEFVDEGDCVEGCIGLIDTPGHTPGHMAGVLESAGQGAVLCGDAVHHPIHVIHPERPGPQDDWVKAGYSRRKILDLCAERDYWLAPAHFQPPHVCKVRKVGEGYRMEWPEELPL
jgi:glyoxylase-like metal-dependent hydrolase (beta-lactamase superfamily II)